MHPFHRPIGLRRGGAAAIGVEYPESPDGRYDFVYPWPVTGALSQRRRARRDRARRPIRPTRPPACRIVEGPAALLELSQHTVIADELLGVGFMSLDRIVRAVPVARLTYDTAPQALELLAELVERWTP